MHFFKLYMLLIVLFAANNSAFAKKDKLEPTSLQKDENGSFYYEKVVTIADSNKEALYGQLKSWVLANVKTVDNSIIFDDKNFSTIVTTPTIALKDVSGLRWVANQRLGFKLVISIKANKFKIQTSSFVYNGQTPQGIYTAPLENIHLPSVYIDKMNSSIDEGFTTFISSLEKAGKGKDKDW